MKVKSEREVTQWYPTLCDPVDYSPPGSSVHGTLQARVPEWAAIAFSGKPRQNSDSDTRHIQSDEHTSNLASVDEMHSPNLPPVMRTFTVLSLGYFIKF